jgi:hypothetical protein
MTVTTTLGPITSVVTKAGNSVQVVPLGKTSYGGVIINPDDASDNLYISIIRTAKTNEDVASGTSVLVPGQTFFVPANCFAWVNSNTSGHRFNAFFNVSISGGIQPVPGNFPPSDVTGLTRVIYSYPYQEYSDDDDIQAFVKSQNALQQNYVDTFNALNLPIYSGALISGTLLDWVAMGIYGYKRPWIFAQKSFAMGTLNTYGPNYLVPINKLVHSIPRGAVIADDDFYKRALTWHYQKGDGKYFNVRWLKRRIKRFLIGVNGSSPPIDETNRISVTFGANMSVTIRFILYVRTVFGGAMCNRFGPNGTQRNKKYSIVPLNSIISSRETLPPIPYINNFSEAVAAGVLELPFQFKYNVVIG